MYMREMGSVELLTREGEIEIAKRIEDGLQAHDPGDLAPARRRSPRSCDLADKIEKDEMQHRRGRRRPHRSERRGDSTTTIAEEDDDEFEDEEDDDDGSGGIAGADRDARAAEGAALERFARIRQLFDEDAARRCEKEGYKAAVRTRRSEDDLRRADDDPLHRARRSRSCATACAARSTTCASYEREIQDARASNKCGMPRAHFIKVFPRNETRPATGSSSEVAAGKPYSESLARNVPAIMELQQKLARPAGARR